MVNFFFAPLYNIFSPFYLLKLYHRRKIRIQIEKGLQSTYTQKEANYWFEGPPFDFALGYAFHNQTIMLSFFFMPILPASIPIGLFTVLVHHYIDKWLILRRHSSPQATGPKLNFAMFKFFDIILIVYAVRRILIIFSIFFVIFWLIIGSLDNSFSTTS